LNKFFEKWVYEAVKEMDEVFTAHQVIAKVVEKKGTSMYVGNAQQVGYLLNKLDEIERIGDAEYRRLDI
jgi:hypothetical protein